jgi:inorganic phosphate transporter, PiT family
MTAVVGVVAIAVLFLAFANGSNDNFKGVATLYGSGTTSYRVALAWASITTLAGSLLAPVLAAGLIQTFKAKGLVPDEVAASPAFLATAALAGAATVIVATRFGLPVSTTHALTGGLIGAGLVATGGHVDLGVLQRGFLMPLLLSPVVAVTIVVIVYGLARGARRATGLTPTCCACIGTTWVPIATLVARGATLAAGGHRLTLATGERAECVRRYDGAFLGIDVQQAIDVAHVASAGAVSFARGLNDTPKILAVLLAVQIGWGTAPPLLGVALAMLIGGVLGARRVAETVSKKITVLDPSQGLVANATTAALVIAASVWKLPVSTTHVSTGSIFGISLIRRSAHWRVLGGIVAAWLTTLPLAAGLGAALYCVISRII